ncbi:MAG: LegC family aminotransferase [Gammaproteobacteria bacterium]
MDTLNPKLVVDAIESLRPGMDQQWSLHQPFFGGREWQYVKDCIDTGWVSSVGKYVDEFEAQLAEYTGSPYAVAVVNGTAALHACLVLAGVQHGDEVLVPALTFVATANAVQYCGAVPHFVDSSTHTLGVDAGKLDAYLSDITQVRNGQCFNRRTGAPIRALVAMHTFGHPVDIDALMEVCDRYGLQFIEDAAESLGSYYKGQHTGTFAPLSALSFNGNKIMTTGGGGAILARDPVLAKRAKHLTTTARVAHRWSFVHDAVGFNYRMPNINAALGCAQLEQVPGFVAAQRRLAQQYQHAFEGIAGVEVFAEPDFACSNYWLNALLLAPEWVAHRDTVLEMSNARGLMTRPAWTLMHRLPMYVDCPRMDLNTAESLEARLINLPSTPTLERGHG